jgi:hypothetical protein
MTCGHERGSSWNTGEAAERAATVLVAALALGPVAACEQGDADRPADGSRVIEMTAGDEAGLRLQSLLDTLSGPTTVHLAPGHYRLAPVDYLDPACGNCQDAAETVPTTRGLRFAGEGLVLVGDSADPSAVVLETRASYGVLFEGCHGCGLRGITVTGGVRDADGRATSAGVVVRDGAVTVEDCRITENLGDSAVIHGGTVVGVAGVAVREGADLTLRRCRVTRNSWDGVALYRGARATVTDNLIDGVDAASGARHGGGRGVGIGATWDARLVAEGNLVTRYWKGIGAFVDVEADVRRNVVEEILTWGIAYWGAADGQPVARIEENAVYDTGACGMSIERGGAAPASDPGHARDNLIVGTGKNEGYDSGEPYCWQRPIARHAVPEGFEIEGNLIFDVRQPGDWALEPALERDAFLEAARPVLDALRLGAVTAGARFLREVAGGARRPEA